MDKAATERNFSEKEKEAIIQLKRLLEWLAGDAGFRREVQADGILSTHLDWMRRIGVTFAPEEAAFICELADMPDLSFYGGREDDRMLQLASRYPLFALWLEYAKMFSEKRTPSCGGYQRFPANRKLDAWRLRRLEGIKSELGVHNDGLFTPVVAFELSDGCGMGCWFCALTAGKLQGVLDYRTQADYVRSILQASKDVLGEEAGKATIFYHATEPHDNPAYIDFLKDFEVIFHHKPNTSTAAAGDTEWVRRLLEYYREAPGSNLRLSVLNTGIMKQLHQEFTPQELQGVKLLMQMKDAVAEKVRAGRLLQEEEGLRGLTENDDPRSVRVPQGTIGCINGFAVNLVRRTIQLISPCYVCRKWPEGYRVYDKDSFRDESDFSAVMQGMIDRNIHMFPLPEQILRFRDDLEYRGTEAGFDLVSPVQIHHFSGNRQLGELVAAGDITCGKIQSMLEDAGMNPFLTGMAIQGLFDDGLVDEVRPE